MGRMTRRINAEISKGLTYEAIIYKDIEHHETDFNYKALEKLAHYEDLEEQGRLIELKCAVGDTVWTKGVPVEISFIHIDKEVTYCIQFDCSGCAGDCPFFEAEVSWEGEVDCKSLGYMEFTNEDIGKTVFLTEEEAAKLEELKGE